MLNSNKATGKLGHEVWLLLGEEACDEYRNSENLGLIADRLQGFEFGSDRDAELFLAGVGHSRHSREWKRLGAGEARKLLARFGKTASVKEVRAG